MGRYRSRSRSLSPRLPSRSPSRRKRFDEPRDRHRGGRSHRDIRSSGPSGLLVRNISLDARQEDLRKPFERFGPVKDVYLPKNYYTGEPRGFGFVKFRNAEDAAEAKQQMNHQIIGGREISIAFAEENRKTPQEMRSNSRVSGRHGGGLRRRTSPRSPRRRYSSYSRSPSPRRDSRDGERSRGNDYYSPRRSISRSPRAEDSLSPPLSPRDNGPRPVNPRNNGGRSVSPRGNGGRSLNPGRNIDSSLGPRGKGPSRSNSRSYSPG